MVCSLEHWLIDLKRLSNLETLSRKKRKDLLKTKLRRGGTTIISTCGNIVCLSLITWKFLWSKTCFDIYLVISELTKKCPLPWFTAECKPWCLPFFITTKRQHQSVQIAPIRTSDGPEALSMFPGLCPLVQDVIKLCKNNNTVCSLHASLR